MVNAWDAPMDVLDPAGDLLMQGLAADGFNTLSHFQSLGNCVWSLWNIFLFQQGSPGGGACQSSASSCM
jgi:hypothetical protein